MDSAESAFFLPPPFFFWLKVEVNLFIYLLTTRAFTIRSNVFEGWSNGFVGLKMIRGVSGLVALVSRWR